jgi:hypothetical protein
MFAFLGFGVTTFIKFFMWMAYLTWLGTLDLLERQYEM